MTQTNTHNDVRVSYLEPASIQTPTVAVSPWRVSEATRSPDGKVVMRESGERRGTFGEADNWRPNCRKGALTRDDSNIGTRKEGNHCRDRELL